MEIIKLALQNKVDNSKTLSTTRESVKYEVYFKLDTFEKIQTFCRDFFIEINTFIEKSLGYYLYTTLDDLEEQNYSLFKKFFELGKVDRLKSTESIPEGNEEINILKVELHPLISKAVKCMCNIIHWTPKSFIAYVISGSINNILKNIKNNAYDFLDIYLDFSELIRSVQEIAKNDAI